MIPDSIRKYVYYEEKDIILLHGDSLEILPLLPEKSVDLVLTDPPYGINGTWNGGSSCGWGRFKGQAEKWDIRSDLTFLSILDCKKIIWGGQYFNLPASGSWLVWDKLVRNFTGGHCELAWTNLGLPIRAFNFCNAELATEGKLHPTQKPLSLIQWCLNFAPSAIKVLDPFLGSGTTAVACKNLGRKCIGIEIEEKYLKIAVDRLRQEVLAEL